MPIIDPSATAPAHAVAKAPVIAAPEYRGVTVDSRAIPSLGITTHIEGSSWSCDYYSQVLDQDSAVSAQQVTRNAIYQQYRLVREFELKVTQPLTSSQDEASKSMIVTGVASVYPFLVPNVGDMFLADIGDGREGVFKVTTSERKSIFKETAHVIEYQLIDYSTDERRGDLNAKTIQTLIFVRDFLQYGQNPLLKEEEHTLLERLSSQYQSLCSKYFSLFTSNEYKTLLVPGQELPIYDHFLTKAVMSFFTTYDSPDVRSVRILNCDGDDVMKNTTIWDALIARDKRLLKYCIRQTGLISRKWFNRNPMLEGIYYSGIQFIVYPLEPNLNVDNQIHYVEKTLSEKTLRDAPSQITRLADLVMDNEFQGLTLPNVPAIKKVLADDYYVLSESFYEDEEDKSLLEICVDTYLDRKPINNRALLALCNTYHSWGLLEQYYYLPVLLMMIKSAIRGI